MHTTSCRALHLVLLVAFAGCSPPGEEPAVHAERPNLLWIVWDTVRADHLGLYGYTRGTTPFLSEWASEARVFENALSVAGYTLASHASMFTGLYPSEHCTHNQHPWLDDSFTTLAELLAGAGYRTFLFSANPYVAGPSGANLAQGFERSEHPWSPKWAPRARALVEAKVTSEDRSSELSERIAAARSGRGDLFPWNIKAAGALAKTATLEWLASSPPERPFAVFLNYMEAHRPLIPPRRLRERFLSPDEVERSYRVNRSWLPMWEYTFGLREYSKDDLALTRATYDAAVLELDELLRDLIEALRDSGYLENTIVILTSDHGEHLGEAHMLDHQYSLHQVLLRVPLVLYAPGRIAPGREPSPVSTFDLFPTLLEITGVAPPDGQRSGAVSLLAPRAQRRLFAEEPASSSVGIERVLRAHPGFDPSSFARRLRALVSGSSKFVWGSDGRNVLYELADDPLETRNLLGEKAPQAARLADELEDFTRTLDRCDAASLGIAPREPTREQREMLENLGYLDDDASDSQRR